MYGREAECALIDSLIARAADARSGVLVPRGEPGIGKSALLDYAAANRVFTKLGLAYRAELARAKNLA
jgi:predicted ATPase